MCIIFPAYSYMTYGIAIFPAISACSSYSYTIFLQDKLKQQDLYSSKIHNSALRVVFSMDPVTNENKCSAQMAVTTD